MRITISNLKLMTALILNKTPKTLKPTKILMKPMRIPTRRKSMMVKRVVKKVTAPSKKRQ